MGTLVTGGAGFIGSHVVDRLVEHGEDVVVLDNLDPQVHGDASFPVNIGDHVTAGRVRFVHGDLRNPEQVDRALAGVDRIVHLAATVGVGQSMYRPHYYTSTNVDGQGVLMEAMAREPGRWKRLVVASSMSIYGEGLYHCSEHGEVSPAARPEEQLASGQWELRCPQCDTALEPRQTPEGKPTQFSSVYAITKKTQEELALCFGGAYGIPTLALRFFNVFGSRQALSNPYTGVAAIFSARLKNGNRPLIFEDGRQSRDFIHVHDVARAVVDALEAPSDASGAYNVCTGASITIIGVAKAIAERLGVDLEPSVVGKFRAGDIRHCVGNPEKMAQDLGFRATISFEDGLDELLRWAEAQETADEVERSMAELQRQGLVR